jgi:hypothetical protein
MVKDIKSLKFYEEPVYYSGLVSLICATVYFYSIFLSRLNPSFDIPLIIFSFIFGALTYYLWITRCPNCKRPFSKKEKLEWKEDLGIRNEPYTYYSKIVQYSDGTSENVPESKKTIMRNKKYEKEYYICKNCDYGLNKEWNAEKGTWIGEKPKPQIIRKKGSAIGLDVNSNFGLNMFEDDFYEYKGKRKNIPKEVKKDLWVRHFGKKYKGNCFVCNKIIDTHNFEAGHVKSVAEGGSDNISNLKPICSGCNKSMGTMNLYKYKDKYYLKNN